MKKIIIEPVSLFMAIYENGFDEFVECAEESTLEFNFTSENLNSLLNEQEEAILEKGEGIVSEEDTLRYYVFISLFIIWYPSQLTSKQVKSFYRSGSKDIKRYLRKNYWRFQDEVQTYLLAKIDKLHDKKFNYMKSRELLDDVDELSKLLSA